MVSAGEVKVNITGDMRDLQIALRQAGQQVDNTADRMERRMQAAYGVLSRGAQIAGVAMAAGIGLAIREAANAEEIRSRFDAVFGELSVSTRQWANETADAVARSSIALEQYLSTFQDTFVPLGATREEAAGLSQQLATLAIDLASFNNENEPETVRALQSAIVGNHETVRRYGVIINQARLEQELLNMGIRGGREAATELEAAQARLNIIMRGTADAQGDAARTAGSATNEWRSFTAELRDAAVAVGDAFMPAAQQVLEWANDLLPVLENVGVAIGNIFSAFVSNDLEEMSLQQLEERLQRLARARDATDDSRTGAVIGSEIAAIEARISALRIEEDLEQRRQQRIGVAAMYLPGGGRSEEEDPEALARQAERMRELQQEALQMKQEIRDGLVQASEDVAVAHADAMESATAAMKDYVKEGVEPVIDEMEEMKRAMEGITEGTIKSLEDAFVDFARTGRVEISNLVDYIIEQFARLAFQEWFAPQIQGGLESIIGGIGSVLGLGSAGASGVTAGGKSGLAGAAQIINIDARYATEGTAAMIEKAFQTQGPQIVNTSVQASVQMVAGMNEAVSVT